MARARVVPVLVLGLLGALTGVGSASAAVPVHARLVSTNPAAGATLGTATEVVLTFSEGIDPRFLDVRVDGPDGDEADGPPSGDGPTVSQALVGPLPAGEHTVTYRVVSDDGHPVSGSFGFTTTGSPATTTPGSTPTTGTPPGTASVAPTATPGSTPSPSTTPASTTSDDVPGWLVPTLVGLIAVVLLAGGFLLSRRRPGPAEDPPA